MTEPSASDDLASLVELLPQAVLVHDDSGGLVVANAAGEELLALDIEPIGGPLPWEGVSESPTTVDLQIPTRGGPTRWMTAQSQVVDRDGRKLVVTTVLDLTERQGWAQSAIEGVIQRFQLSWARSHLPVFLVRIDDEGFGRVLVGNAALTELFGGEGPLAGRHLAELFDMPGHEGRDGADDLLRRLMASEDRGPTVTSRAIRPDGTSQRVLLGLTVARGPVGRPLFVLGYAIDESPLEASESSRRRDLAHTELIYEYGSDVVVVLTADGEFDFVGPSARHMLGYDRHELLGGIAFDLIHPEDRELAEGAFGRAMAQPGINPPVHLRILDGDDRWRQVEIVARNLLDVPEVGGVVLTIRDRTDQARAEEDLERSQRQMFALLEAQPDLIFRLGADGTYLDYHSPDASLLVVPPEVFMGRRVDEVVTETFAPGVAREIVAAIGEVLATGEPRAVHYQLDLPDGVHHFEARLAPIEGDEVIVVVRDISDLRRSELQRLEHERELVRWQAALERAALERELERASRIEAMGYLAATMAHDVNNLLGVINNYASSIRRSQPGWSVQRDAEEISAAVARGAELTQHLLRIGRRPAEAHAVEPVRDVVKELADSLRGAFDREGGAELLTELPQEPATVRGSRPRIEQAIMNLVLNARDAAEAAGGRVVVTLAVERRCASEDEWRPDGAAPGEYVVVSVVDGGGGIPEQVRSRVFEPFFSTKDGSNSGLGLPIVREVVEQHGGGVGIHSVEVDGVAGTRMELWLPAAAVPAGDAQPLRSTHRSVRVLLVDDDDDVRRSTRHLLEGMGHDVVDVRSASGAMAVIDGGAPVDLVLSDVRMPGVTGPELVRRLRDVAPGLPALFVTGYADDLSSATDLCDVPILVKPYGLEELSALIEEHARPE